MANMINMITFFGRIREVEIGNCQIFCQPSEGNNISFPGLVVVEACG